MAKIKCDRCDRPATVHVTEKIEGGEEIDTRFCEEHAVEAGLVLRKPPGESFRIDPPAPPS